MSGKIRIANIEDADKLVAIYKPYVEKTSISFEYNVPSVEEFEGRMREVKKLYPYLVYEEDGEILGYAYAGKAHKREAYQWCAETSIYVGEDARGKKVGQKLYQVLLDIIKAQGVHIVYAILVSPNIPSEKIHQSFGFREAVRFEKAGYKLGKWHDTKHFELIFNGAKEEPQAIRPIEELIKSKEVEQIIEKYI